MSRICPPLAVLVVALATIPPSSLAQATERMETAARTVLEARTSGLPGEWEFVADGSPPNAAEAAQVDIQAGDFDGPWPRSRVGIPVHVNAEGSRPQSYLLWFSVRRWQEVPVYTVDARAGDDLVRVRTHVQRQDMARFGNAMLLTEQVSGVEPLRLKRSVRAGQPALRDDFEAAPPVARQKDVLLTVSQGPVRLQTRAMAQRDASVGELVRVLPSGSNQWVQARVTGPGEVNLEN